MAFGRVQDYYLRSTDLAPAEVNKKRLLDSQGSVNNDLTKCDFGGTVLGAKYVLAVPLVTSGVDAGSPPFTFQNKGWKVDPDDMNSVAGATRFIPTGTTWTFTFNVIGTIAQVAIGTLVHIVAWKVNAAGTGATKILEAENAIRVLVLTTPTIIIVTGIAEVAFGPGETLMLEPYINAPGLGLGQVISLRIESVNGASGPDTVLNTSNPLLTAWTPTATDDLPLAETITRQVNTARNVVDALPLTDSASATKALYPTATDALPLTDSVTSRNSAARELTPVIRHREVAGEPVRLVIENRALGGRTILDAPPTIRVFRTLPDGTDETIFGPVATQPFPGANSWYADWTPNSPGTYTLEVIGQLGGAPMAIFPNVEIVERLDPAVLGKYHLRFDRVR